MKRYLTYAIGGLLLTIVPACSDHEPRPSKTDNKLWELDGNMDESYAPGDNFFMYCHGAWWNRTDLGDSPAVGFMATEIPAIIDMRLKQLDDPRISKVEHEVANFESGYESGFSFICDRANAYEGLSMVDATVMFLNQGYDNFITFTPLPLNGQTMLYVQLAPEFADIMNITPDEDIAEYIGNPDVASGKRLECYRQLCRLPSMSSRSGNRGSEDFFEAVFSKLGLDFETVMFDEDFDDVVEEVYEKWAEIYKQYIRESVLNDLRYVSQSAIDRFNDESGSHETIGSLARKVKNKYMGYLTSHAYATKYVSPALKEEYTAICEEFRKAFRRRVENLDWMSGTTRSRAIEKLDRMKFNIGYPDRWFDEGLARLDGASLAEDVTQLRAAKFRLALTLAAYSPGEVGMELFIFRGHDLTIDNAFYQRESNCILMLPSNLLPPYYESKMSDAFIYGVMASSVGHEITHGFDSDGSEYNEYGAPENWWTVADKMEFEDRYRMLIESRNHLELLPDEMPGVYSPGEQTISEDIADLGGLNIGLDVYGNKLKVEGYRGEELLRQERRFFRGFAEVFRKKYDSRYVNECLFVLKDVHSMAKERVNGTVMNIDRWYELFNVQRGDILYLPEEKRCHLW